MDQKLMTFSEFLERRTGGHGASIAAMPCADRGAQVDERLFPRGMFKAVNPSRPVSPLNSRDLGSPDRKTFKSQVVGH